MENISITLQIGTIIAIFSSIAVFSWKVATLKKDFENKIESLEKAKKDDLEEHKEFWKTLDKLKEADQKQDLLSMEIKTKLESIEATLIEIKANMKK